MTFGIQPGTYSYTILWDNYGKRAGIPEKLLSPVWLWSVMNISKLFLKLQGIGRCREACVLLYQLFRVIYTRNPPYNYLPIINMHRNSVQWQDRKKIVNVLNKWHVRALSVANLSSIRTGVWKNHWAWKRSCPPSIFHWNRTPYS
jgi:hypothetical protein